MKWSLNLFGAPAHESETHAVRFEEAKDAVLDRIQTTVVDHNGRRLNERRWRDYRDFVESL